MRRTVHTSEWAKDVEWCFEVVEQVGHHIRSVVGKFTIVPIGHIGFEDPKKTPTCWLTGCQPVSKPDSSGWIP